jgi:hypothetical protein
MASVSFEFIISPLVGVLEAGGRGRGVVVRGANGRSEGWSSRS